MKLLLASNGEFLIDQRYALLAVPKAQMHIGYVTTASKGARSTEYVERHKQAMKENSYRFEEIDIEGKSTDELEKFFRTKNIIHVEGGDTYYLLRAIKRAGFDALIKKYLAEGKIYVGTSAGSSITGPTIELSSHIPKDATPEGVTGLGLVPFMIKAHFTDEQRSGLRQQIKTLRHPAKILRDGQAILVENGNDRIVGQGEEVKL